MTLFESVVFGVSGGLTLGVSQFVADEYVKPWLRSLKNKHEEGIAFIKDKFKPDGGL
jgi:hypothetical protein